MGGVWVLIDLHIHSSSSDGQFSAAELIREAKVRGIGFMSITDHDSIECQKQAVALAKQAGICYMSGVELNATFQNSRYHKGKPVAVDFLGYQFDVDNEVLKGKLEVMADYRRERAAKILANLNAEFNKEGIAHLTFKDLKAIEASVEGSLGRPHIADYLVKKQIVASRQEAFDKYLVKCDVPKYPFTLQEASKLIHDAGGKLILAHPNEAELSLGKIASSLNEQTQIIQESIIPCIDGVECWHPSHDRQSTNHYLEFAKRHELIVTGGSDCHQKPLMIGTLQIPDYVYDQFRQ